jgi:prepilin signal peptidase PulO-like enzyme (type II secretory pathway)
MVPMAVLPRCIHSLSEHCHHLYRGPEILQSWVCWRFVDGLSIYLYRDRALHFTALLFAFYIVITFFGWHQWQKYCQLQSSPACLVVVNSHCWLNPRR